MFIRRLGSVRPARPATRGRKPGQNRAWRFILTTLGSGALAAMIAIAIAGIPTVLSLAFPSDPPPQIDASALFPPAPVVHKVVNVYDPPPPQWLAPRPRPVTPTSRPVTESPRPEPSEPPDD